MQDLVTAITTLNTFGWSAICVFLVAGFLSGAVLTRGHHKEVIEGFRSRIQEYEDQLREVRSENQQLRQALAIVQAQATRATAVTATVVEQNRGGM